MVKVGGGFGLFCLTFFHRRTSRFIFSFFLLLTILFLFFNHLNFFINVVPFEASGLRSSLGPSPVFSLCSFSTNIHRSQPITSLSQDTFFQDFFKVTIFFERRVICFAYGWHTRPCFQHYNIFFHFSNFYSLRSFFKCLGQNK